MQKLPQKISHAFKNNSDFIIVHFLSICFLLDMSVQLDIKAVEFSGIGSIDPEFNPNLKEFVIHRKAGSEFRFKVTLNKEPNPVSDDPNYCAYEMFDQTFSVDDESNGKFWAHNEWSELLGCSRYPEYPSTLVIKCVPNNRYKGNFIPSSYNGDFCLIFQ